MQSPFSQIPSAQVSPGNIHIRVVAQGLVFALFLFVTVAGCQTQRTHATAQNDISNGSNYTQNSASTAGSSGHMTTATLTDASFGGMQAAEVDVPAGWKVQGHMLESPCTSIPSASWDAVSPDGQSELHVLPLFGWRWGNSPQGHNGCIPLNQPLKAADFLQAFARRLPGNARVVGSMPVADAFRRREENLTKVSNNSNANTPAMLRVHAIGDVAALRVMDSSGHEMRLRAFTVCRMRSGSGDCIGRIEMLRAPKGRLNGLVALVDNYKMLQEQPTQEWLAAYMNHQQQVGRQQMDQLRQNENAGNRALAQQRRNADAGSQMLHDQYLSSSERLNAEHQAGMQQIQRSTDSSMRNAQNSQNARTTAASDMEDYSLNQQTVSGANGTYKTSSQYSNVWSSPNGPALSDGRTFGSTNNAVDPNSATDNTWTKDTKVHGNGQPY
jgi:hypothetical protein